MTIKTYETVFPEELLKQLTETLQNVPWQYGWHSNKNIEFTHWNHSFVRAGAHNGIDVAGDLPPLLATAWQYIQDTITGPMDLLRCYANTHTFGIEGYPHTDSRRDADETIVIYFSPYWQRNWGGETIVYDGDTIIHAELPRYNKGLRFHGNQWHQARSVTRICPAQRITLMFKFAPKNLDPLRNRIQAALTHIGANKIKHSGRNLLVHLLNTYDILRSWGYDDDTCAAGAGHSIFGTNVFKTVAIPHEKRQEVVNIVGENATMLIELFKDIRRPQTLEKCLKTGTKTVEMNDGSTRELTMAQLNSLCAIEAANLTDQSGLKNYPQLQRYVASGKHHAKEKE